MRQDVAGHLFAHHKTACLLTLSPLACHEAACGEPVKRRFNAWSGRRDSNPRQPAWKAGILLLSLAMDQSDTSSSSSLAFPFPSLLQTVPQQLRAQVVSDPSRYSLCICTREEEALYAVKMPLTSLREGGNTTPEKRYERKERIFIMEKQNDPSLQPLLLTVPQVAKKLGLSRAMVYVLINREGLPVIRLGRAVRISVTSLQKWVEEREQASMRMASS